MIKLLILFKTLSIKEKIISMGIFIMLLLACLAFLNGKFVTYTDDESRKARVFAVAEQNELEEIAGLTVLQQLMSAKPNSGWGISFLFKYVYSRENLIKSLEAKNWRYLGQAEESSYIKQTKVEQFCQNRVLLKVFLYEMPNSMHLGFNPDTCP